MSVKYYLERLLGTVNLDEQALVLKPGWTETGSTTKRPWIIFNEKGEEVFRLTAEGVTCKLVDDMEIETSTTPNYSANSPSYPSSFSPTIPPPELKLDEAKTEIETAYKQLIGRKEECGGHETDADRANHALGFDFRILLKDPNCDRPHGGGYCKCHCPHCGAKNNGATCKKCREWLGDLSEHCGMCGGTNVDWDNDLCRDCFPEEKMETPKQKQNETKPPAAPKKRKRQPEEKKTTAQAQEEHDRFHREMGSGQMTSEDFEFVVKTSRDKALQTEWKQVQEQAAMVAAKQFAAKNMTLEYFERIEAEIAQRERNYKASKIKCKCIRAFCHCYDNGPRMSY